MAKIYAKQLIKGNLSWSDVVDGMKEPVMAILQENVRASKITDAEYEQITGQPYVE